VQRLLADQLRDHEPQLLVTTVRTVEAHVTHIFDKLGFSSRTQVAVWAVVKGLARPSPAWEEEVQG